MPEKIKAADLDKLRKLVDAWHDVRSKETDIVAEIGRILGGEVSIGVLLKRADEAFALAWGTRYPGAYVWQYAKDRPQMKQLILKLGVDELTARFARYLQNDDPFFLRARHSFGAFVATVNQHAGPASAAQDLELGDDVVECSHTPPCKNDAEHTRRKATDMGLR